MRMSERVIRKEKHVELPVAWTQKFLLFMWILGTYEDLELCENIYGEGLFVIYYIYPTDVSTVYGRHHPSAS